MPPKSKADEYERLIEQLDKFFAKYKVDTCGRMATIKCVGMASGVSVKLACTQTSLVLEPGKTLQIGPYQGAVLACGLIEFGKGVCGTSALDERTQVVEDVSKISNYISCDEDTKSEIVVPVFGRNYHNEADVPADSDVPKKLIAVLDIDADVVGAFDNCDAVYLERICERYF